MTEAGYVPYYAKAYLCLAIYQKYNNRMYHWLALSDVHVLCPQITEGARV